jgi:hypothetical protein
MRDQKTWDEKRDPTASTIPQSTIEPTQQHVGCFYNIFFSFSFYLFHYHYHYYHHD